VESLRVERRFFCRGHRRVTAMPNVMAKVAVFLVSSRFFDAETRDAENC